MRLLCAAILLLAAACNDGISCDTVTDDLGDLCLPATLAPGIPSVVEVRELCGAGCTGAPSCTALLRGGQVTLDVEHDVCSDSQTRSCIQLGCQQRVMRCVLPSLNAGDYTLSVPGGPSRILRVAAGGDSSCRFPASDGGVQ